MVLSTMRNNFALGEIQRRLAYFAQLIPGIAERVQPLALPKLRVLRRPALAPWPSPGLAISLQQPHSLLLGAAEPPRRMCSIPPLLLIEAARAQLAFWGAVAEARERVAAGSR